MTYTAMPIEELDVLPRAAFIAAIEPLFEGAPALVERLAGDRPFGSWWNLLARARVVAHALPEPDRIELLNSHPRLGAPPESVSRLSYEEQGYDRPGTPGTGDEAAQPAAPAVPTSPPAPPRPTVPHIPAVSSTGLRSRLEGRPPAGSPPPMWGSSASAGAAPAPPSAAAAKGAGSAGSQPPAPTPNAPAAGTVEGDTTRAKLARLNAAYEDWFGFRYCVFVAGRPLEALVPELELAMAQSREHELQRGVDAVIDIAIARSGMAR